MKKVKRISRLEARRSLISDTIPEVRKLVAKYDLPAVSSAVKALYDERKAAKELEAAEAKVAALRGKLKK